MRDRTRKPQEQGQAIDLTPMLDVVFIMLIFFIVTASFIKEPGTDIARTAAVMAEKKKVGILVAINNKNEIWIDKKRVDPQAVKLSILRLYTENPKGGMVIQADNEAEIGMVALVADAAKEVGVIDISVSTGNN